MKSKPIFMLYYSWTFNMIDKHFWWWSSDSMWITHGIIIIIYLLLFHNKNISNALWTWHKKVFLLLTNWVLTLGEHNWIVSCTYFISNMKVEVCLKIFVCDFSHSQKNLVVAIITNLKNIYTWEVSLSWLLQNVQWIYVQCVHYIMYPVSAHLSMEPNPLLE